MQIDIIASHVIDDIYHYARLELVVEQRDAEFDDLRHADGNIDEMRLLVTHRRTVLYASQHITNVREGPRTEMAHGQSRLVVDVRVAADLILLIVHQGFHDQAVHPRHVYRRKLARIETSLHKRSISTKYQRQNVIF